MRRVQHSMVPTPKVLSSSQATEARRVIQDLLSRDSSELATRRAPIDEKIIQDRQVYAALENLFLSKCAFCEESPQKLEIDHYRPIANATDGSRTHPHHYSWLAYEWENLLQVCDFCSRRKGTNFPLRNGTTRLLSPLDQLRSEERPDIIDPGFDRPERHLDFTLDGRCHPRSQRGAATIRLLDLNREPLVTSRGEVFSDLVRNFDGANSPLDALQALMDVQPDSRFAGALYILRYRYATALADAMQRPRASFVDSRGALQSLHRTASIEVARTALDTLMSPGSALRAAIVTRQSPAPTHHPTPRTMRRASIRGFKGIRELDLEFAERRPGSRAAGCTMILGENAAGKSSVLQAIALALSGANIANSLGRNAFNLVNHGASSATITLEFFDGPPARLEIERGSGRFHGTAEPSALVQAYGSRRLFARTRPHTAEGRLIRGLFDPLWVFPSNRGWLQRLGDAEFFEVARALRLVLSLADTQDFKRARGEGVTIVDPRHQVPIAEHSDGYQSLFGLAVDVMREMRGTAPDLAEARGVVLIDELETHLHPRWKMQVMRALRDALPLVQFIATTHDPLCLQGMEDGEIEVLVREDGDVRRIENLPSVRGMRAEQLLTSEFFGLGSTDPDTEAKNARYHFLSAKDFLSPDELEERRLLSEVLSRIPVGDTFLDQIVSEALRRADLHPFATVQKVTGARREAMISQLLQQIRAAQNRIGRPQ